MSAGSVRKSLSGLRAYGPYVLMEMLLPGGTLLALLLWLSQRLGYMGSGSVYRYLLAQRYRAAVAAKPHALETELWLDPVDLLCQ
ncbi:MAG: hypothetical protein ACREUX_05165 [Burkholderiales bacterium]